MGELHLEIITDRLAREFGVAVKSGRPQVVYRETLRKQLEHREIFRVEQDGRVLSGEVLLALKPLERGSGVRVVLDGIKEGTLPMELRAVLTDCLSKGCAAGGLAGYPVTDIQIEVREAPYEQGVTSEAGIRAAAQRGLAKSLREGGVVLLEPIMALDITAPGESMGRVIGSLQQKRGRVEGIEVHGTSEVIRALVPLAEMFGYMTELRSATKGRGTFSMEFNSFADVPPEIQSRFGV
jgi:elongation factor G